MIFGYPEKGIEALAKSVETLLKMKNETNSLSHEQLLDINAKGAKRVEAFTAMLTNMATSYGEVSESVDVNIIM